MVSLPLLTCQCRRNSGTHYPTIDYRRQTTIKLAWLT